VSESKTRYGGHCRSKIRKVDILGWGTRGVHGRSSDLRTWGDTFERLSQERRQNRVPGKKFSRSISEDLMAEREKNLQRKNDVFNEMQGRNS